jgi:cytochrome c-type biogenesis protein CcsB
MGVASLSYAKPDLERTVGPLRAMPVQDSGFIRSATTFSEHHLAAIHDKARFEGRPALPVIIELLVHPDKAQSLPLLKLGHPAMGQLYGAKHISLEDYRDPSKTARLAALYQRNPNIDRMVRQLEYAAHRLDELPFDFAIIPPIDAASPDAEWLSPARLEDKIRLQGYQPDAVERGILDAWNALREAAGAGRFEDAEKAAVELNERVRAAALERGAELPRLKLDAFYHAFAPFKKAAVFYLLATLVYLFSLLFKRPRAAWGGFAFLVLGLALQCVGVWARWLLSGRAPLANMYESFTFAVGGFVLVALLFELKYRVRLAGFGAALLGFVLMILAHKAPIFDSKISPLMPALQSSWLTYHVVTIMLSYSAFLLSFFACVVWLVKDLCGGDACKLPVLRAAPRMDSLEMINYKIIAVGFPLLTIGIILGAVWANTAWGRPWGFDPKETWSAVTWLVYAAYLHVRHLSGWRGRGAILLSLLGFGCVVFTYFGVNYILSGLHSYA